MCPAVALVELYRERVYASGLKPPRTKHLKLNCGILLSTLAFKFNLRRYNKGSTGQEDPDVLKERQAGAYTCSRWSST